MSCPLYSGVKPPSHSPQFYVGPGEIRLRLDNKHSIGPVQIESADFILGIEG